MQAIATQVPTTIEELADCGLPENVQKQYGERLVKCILSYIEMEKLEKYIQNRPKKKQKTEASSSHSPLEQSKPVLIDVPDDSADEFDDGIDYSAIEIPGGGKTAETASNLSRASKKSSYFY